MKYALVLESGTTTCNDTCMLLASLGYLITPVFSPKKALHAAHMIQFDLIVTCSTAIPGDRRSLAAELARCSPEAVVILLGEHDFDHVNGISAVLCRPLAAHDVEAAIARGPGSLRMQPALAGLADERRKRAVD